MDKYESLKQIISSSNSIVFFTGAGISTPSNIPDFRSANGLYNDKNYLISPEEIISHHFFLNNTEKFYEFYLSKMVFPKAKPNNAHTYISELEKNNPNKQIYVVTQNIDNLHQMAGSKHVTELHGSVHRNYCMNCSKFYNLDDILKFKGNIPICPRCGGIIKPDVVLYEEQLNEVDIENAINVISRADTLIVIGSSLVVYPAASFIGFFKGKHLIVINKDSTSYDQYCELVFHEDIIKVINNIKDK